MKHQNENWKKQYFTLWAAQGMSLLTSSILQMSIVWYITETTESAIYLSIAAVCAFLPQGILGPILGSYIDRYPRKKIMIISDLSIGLSSLSLAIISLFTDIPLPLIFIVLILRSIGTAFHHPAFEALIATIVPKERLTSYAGYSQGFKSISLILSPALGATFYAFWGLNLVILFDFFAALIAIAILFGLKVKTDTPISSRSASKASVLKEALEGLHIIRKHKGLTTLIIIGIIYSFFYVPVGTLLPFIVITHFDGTVPQSGIVEIFFSSGALLGAFILAKIGDCMNKIKAISLSIFFYGLGTAISGVLPSDGLYFFMGLCLVMGLAAPFYSGVQVAIFQTIIPNEYLGRAFSTIRSSSILIMPLSLSVSGFAVEALGVDNWFLLLGILIIALSFSLKLFPSLRNCCVIAMNQSNITPNQKINKKF